MNSKKKRMSIVLIVVGLLIGVGINLMLSSKESKEEDEELTAISNNYLEEHFKGKKLEIYDIYHDTSSVFGYFEKAALIRDKDSDLEFKVFVNKDTGTLEDSYTAEKNDSYIKNVAKNKMDPYLNHELNTKGTVKAKEDKKNL